MIDITNLSFSAAGFFQNGYDQEEVDQFLDRAAASLALPLAERTLRAEDTAEARFSVTKFRPGYDIEEVDKTLAEIGVELAVALPG